MQAILILLLLLISPTLTAGPGYPANPQTHQGLIFLSHQGITAYDSQTLKPRWTRLTKLQPDAPTLADNTLLIGSSSGLFALDRGSGNTLWRYGPGKRLFSPSVIGNHAFIAGLDGYLHKVQIDTGHVIWQRKISHGWIYSPGIIGNTVITGGQEGILHALDATTGEPRWRYELGQELVFRPIPTADGSIIATSFQGKVFAIDGHSGRLRWQRQHPVASFSPVIEDGQIYLSGYDNRLRVLAGNSGQLLWQTTLPGRTATSPQIHNGKILAVTQEGDYLLLDHLSGKRLNQGRIESGSLGALLLNDQTSIFFSKTGNIPAIQPVSLHRGN